MSSKSSAQIVPAATDEPTVDAPVTSDEIVIAGEPTVDAPVTSDDASDNAGTDSETAGAGDPLTPPAAPKFNVKRDVTNRMLALVSDNLNLLIAGATTPEQTAAARAFVANYFSYAPGVQSGKTEWPSNLDAITALKK